MEIGFEFLKTLKNFDQIAFFRIVVIIVIGWALIRLVERIFPIADARLPGRFRLNLLHWAPVFRLLIILTVIVSIIPLVIKPTANNLLIFFGAIGIAVGFALKEFINSIIAGVLAVYERPYRPGDWVEIDGIYGEVRSMDLRTLKIVTPDDTQVLLPHKKIWDTPILNASSGKRDLQCMAHFYLDPEHDPSVVKLKLHDVALSSSYVNLNRPIVIVMEEHPWYSHYKIRAYPIDGRDQFQFITDLTMRGKNVLRSAGIKSAAPCSRES